MDLSSIPGLPHYHGRQLNILKRIVTYAIERHIVLDIHPFPGDVNFLKIDVAHGQGN